MSFESQAEPLAARPAEAVTGVAEQGQWRSLTDIWRVLNKRRLTILIVTIFSVAAAAWYAFRTQPVYDSVSRVQVKPNELSSAGPEAYFEDPTSQLETEMLILQSDTVLFQTAQSLDLIRLVRSGNKNGGAGSTSSEISPQERRALIGIVGGGLSIKIVPNTQILEIHYRGPDPKLATAIVNQLVDTYSDEELRAKFERTSHVSDWLEKRMDDLRQEASDTQRQLAEYQRSHNIVGVDETSNLTMQTLESVSGNLNEAEADRIMKEARMRDFDSLNPDMVALMGDDPTIAALHTQLTDLETQRAQMATKYGPKHPQMQQIDLQISKVQAQINNEISLAHHQVQDEYENSLHVEDAVRKRLAAQEDAAYRLNEDAAQYSILRHQAEATRELYDTLEMKLKEASVTAGMSAANITVVDRADVPFIPVAPQKRQALMYGLVGGILFGCVLAFVIESIDDRLSTSEEVENASMLPSLAAIPHFSYGQERRKGEAREEVGSGALQTARQLITLHDPKSNGAEAYRGMRSSLLLSSIDNPPRVIMVTSSFPSEGKTTTSLNLAIVLAQRGEKVLLVDADLRRGSLNRVFGITDQTFGLSAVLTQPGLNKEIPAPLPELPMLHVLTTGPRPPNPAEMLSSNRMEEQMRHWAQQFDRIVIDTAPLLAVSDTQAMAVRADAVVLVARAGVTRKRALNKARDILWRINAAVVGVVVNDVDMRLENFYTYRYGIYAKDFLYGYDQGSAASERAYGYKDEGKGE